MLIIKRIDIFKNLTARTFERLSGKSFRKGGPMEPEYKKILNNAYLSSLQAASMAFKIKFGNPSEPTIPGLGRYETIIDDITENITLINDKKIDVLKGKINDNAYFDNFLALTKELAPDGNIVNLFGITSIKHGQERKTILTERKEKISEVIRISQSESDTTNNNLIEKSSNQTIAGILKVANANTNIVEIMVDGLEIKLKVPDGLSDIVRKYWDEKVVVEYHKKNKKDNVLISIEEELANN